MVSPLHCINGDLDGKVWPIGWSLLPGNKFLVLVLLVCSFVEVIYHLQVSAFHPKSRDQNMHKYMDF
jgi:hypothetical protein